MLKINHLEILDHFSWDFARISRRKWDVRERLIFSEWKIKAKFFILTEHDLPWWSIKRKEGKTIDPFLLYCLTALADLVVIWNCQWHWPTIIFSFCIQLISFIFASNFDFMLHKLLTFKGKEALLFQVP